MRWGIAVTSIRDFVQPHAYSSVVADVSVDPLVVLSKKALSRRMVDSLLAPRERRSVLLVMLAVFFVLMATCLIAFTAARALSGPELIGLFYGSAVFTVTVYVGATAADWKVKDRPV